MRGPAVRSLFPACAALAALVVLGSGAPACGLSVSVDDVLQPEDNEAAGGSPTGSASTSSAGGGGGGGGGSGSTTGSGGGSGVESCQDGVDNDGDGMADCADTDCDAGFECVDTAPGGWDGPYRVTTSTLPVSVPVLCDGGTTPEKFFADPAGPAECTACTCSDVMGASCSPPAITCYPGSPSCLSLNAQDLTAALQGQACGKPANQLGMSNQLSCSITAPTALAQNGSCAPSTVDFPNKELFGTQVDACALPTSGGGCGTGQACVPKAEGAGQSVCIRQDGASKQCPAGFSTNVQGYQSGDDTRGCSDCQCGDANATCAGGGYTFYDLNGCATQGQSDPPIVIDSNMCDNVSVLLDGQSVATTSWSIEPMAPTVTGGCAPQGGQPTGEVNVQGPVTFCCK